MTRTQIRPRPASLVLRDIEPLAHRGAQAIRTHAERRATEQYGATMTLAATTGFAAGMAYGAHHDLTPMQAVGVGCAGAFVVGGAVEIIRRLLS